MRPRPVSLSLVHRSADMRHLPFQRAAANTPPTDPPIKHSGPGLMVLNPTHHRTGRTPTTGSLAGGPSDLLQSLTQWAVRCSAALLLLVGLVQWKARQPQGKRKSLPSKCANLTMATAAGASQPAHQQPEDFDDWSAVPETDLPPTARSILDQVAIVCCEPQGPQNVGGAARCLQNFGLGDLRVVAPAGGITEAQVLAPGCRDKDPTATAFREEVRTFARTAGWVLDRTESEGGFQTTADAIRDCTFVVGTSVRQRGDTMPFFTPRQAVKRILEEAQKGKVAILFGNERIGLTSEDLKMAHACIAIPTQTIEGEISPTSLNLSHALAIICYEIYHETLGEGGVGIVDQRGEEQLLDSAGREHLVGDLLRALQAMSITPVGPEAETEEQEQWEKIQRKMHGTALERLLSVGSLGRRDTRVLFWLARRIVAAGHLAQEHDGELPLIRLLRVDLQKRVDSGEFDGQVPTHNQLREYLRSQTVTLTKREVEILQARLKPAGE